MRSDPVTRFRCTTLRRSGATDIRIVYAANTDAARERLIAAGLEPVAIEAVGPSLSSRLLAWLRETPWHMRDGVPLGSARKFVSKPLLGATYLLATASVTLMVGSWTFAFFTMWQIHRFLDENAAPIAHHQHRLSDEGARTLARPAMTEPGPSETLGRLAAILPSDTSLVSAARDPKGALRIELDTSDPDQIRPILNSDPLFGSLKEASQVQTSEGKMRVTWTSGPR